MKVAIFTSVSQEIEPMARLTNSNKLEYCTRHNYSLVVHNESYKNMIDSIDILINLLNMYDILWTLDADAIITNMNIRIEKLECLGPHMTVCEEGIVPWNLINCGSMVWKNTLESRGILKEIAQNKQIWGSLVCGWQTWLAINKNSLGNAMTIAPLRSFNSCVWNKPGNGPGLPGSHWQEGDFIYHPCGVFPYDTTRVEYITSILDLVQR